MMKRTVTILYIIDTHLPANDHSSPGGAEKQLDLLTASLSPDIFRPIVVQLVVSGSGPVFVGKKGNVSFYHLPTDRFYNLRGFRQISRIISIAKKENAAIIHTFFDKAEVIGWLTSRLARIPVWITSRRDMGFKRKNGYKKIFRFAARDCRLCIANCYAIKKYVMQHEGLPEDKVRVIFNGVKFSDYTKAVNGNMLRAQIGASENVPLVGLAANFNFEIKGHTHFIKAAKIVLEEISDVEFLLAGDGPLRDKYEGLARDLGISEKIHFLGRREDMPDFLSNITVSVLSSTSEGLSNVLLESMAAGTPVVATAIGGTPELIRDGITGHLVPPSDEKALASAIISVLRRPDRALSMGLAAKEHIQREFTIEAMVKAYEHCYLSLLHETKV